MATATVQDEILKEESQQSDKPFVTSNENSSEQNKPPDKEKRSTHNQTLHGLVPVQTLEDNHAAQPSLG